KGVATLESVVEKGKGRVPLGTYWYLSEGYYKMGRYDDALAKAKQGVASLRRMGQTENLLQALTWQARASRALGSEDDGITVAVEALDVVERMRARLAPADDLKRGFSERHVELAHEAIAWLEEAGRHEDALEIAEQARGRAFLDLLTTRRAEDLFE